MKISSIVAAALLAVVSPAVGQQTSPADQEMMKVRQTMTNQYAEAIGRKDAAAMADHYTADVVTASVCPESPPVVGREALVRRAYASIRAGIRDYSGRVKEVHLLGDGLAWSTGTSAFTINDKDGEPQQVRLNWLDMLRREGTVWRVSFQAFARVRCSP